MKLDVNGDSIKVFRWGRDKNDDLLRIIKSSAGYIVGAGITNSNSDISSLCLEPNPCPGDANILLMKIDWSGNLSTHNTKILKPIILFPNPFYD